MNSDPHDPQNNVPPVYPGDAWGDLDGLTEMPQGGLPPRRPGRGIPTRRELNPVSAKRHAPRSKLYDDSPIPSIEHISDGFQPPARPQTQTADHAAKEHDKRQLNTATKQNSKALFTDELGKLMDQAPRKVSEETASGANHEFGVELDANEQEIFLPLTVTHGTKRYRVNEIAPQRPVEKRVQKTPLIVNKMAGKRTSNEALMQNSIARSPKEFSSGAKNLRQTLAWMIGAGAVIIAIVIGAIFLSRPPKDRQELGKLSVFSDATTEESDHGSELEGGESLNTLINGEEQAKVIFATYATSKSVDDFIGKIYLPEKNRGVISNSWEPMGLEPGWKPGENGRWTVSEKGGVKYAILSALLADFSGFNAVFRQDGDSMKMDWRATTGHCSADYAELKKGQGDGAEIRAILSPGDFHTFTLPEGEFRCYRLTAPDKEENVWGYTKLNDANDEKLLAQFIPSQLTGDAVTEIPVVLVLARGPTQSLPNQWMISKVMRLSWLDE